MSRLDGSSEATMEEILASIRKIIADEPASAKAVPEPPPGPSGLPLPAAAEPLVPDAPAAAPRAAAMPQFRSAAPATPSALDMPLPTPPRSRASAIDDDLAGLIDAPASAPKAAAVAPVEAAREKWANLLNPGVARNSSPARTPSAPKVDGAPASAPAAAAATLAAPLTPPPGSGIFAPRKGGFYPPQEPARAEPGLTAPSGFMPAAKASEPAPTAVTQPNTTPAAAEAPAPVPSASEPVAKIAAASASATDAVPDVTAASARALDALAAGLNKSVASIGETPVAAETRAVAAGEPFVTAPLPAAVTDSAPPAAERAATPGAEKTAADTTLNGRAPAATTVVVAAASQGRSFEEVVAEMLRPMLEKWIAENMPRIVERALKLDASSGPKSDS